MEVLKWVKGLSKQQSNMKKDLFTTLKMTTDLLVCIEQKWVERKNKMAYEKILKTELPYERTKYHYFCKESLDGFIEIIRASKRNGVKRIIKQMEV